MNDTNCDVTIIGSGVSGLTAAAILAKKGKRVVIVEKEPRPGGALKRFKRGNITFDVGFHATGCLGKGDILSSLWEYCGVMPELTVIPYPEQSCDLFEFEEYDRPIRGYFSHERYLEELKAHFPSEAGAIDDYFRKVGEICHRIPFYNRELSLTHFFRGMQPAPHSLTEYLASITSNPFLQAVLAAPIFLYGVPSSLASVEIHAQVVLGYHQGTYIVDGGGQAVVDAFVKVLHRLGVRILTGETVTAINTGEGKVLGVTTASGSVIQSPDVICAAHPAQVVGMLPETAFRAAYRKRLKGLRNSISYFMLFGSIDDPPDPDTLDWTNLYKFIPGLNILPATPELPRRKRGLMLTCPGRRDRKDVQFNKNGVILFQPAYWEDVKRFEDSHRGRRPGEYRAFKEELTEQMLEDAWRNWDHICGRVTPLAVGTPLTFRDELSSPEGSAYGAMHSIDQYTPGVRTRVPGLWFCGQSTLMTGVMSSSLSGMLAAGEMTGLESLWEEIRGC